MTSPVKTCRDCGRTKPLSEFVPRSTRTRTASATHQSYCKACWNVRTSARAARIKAEGVYRVVREKPCSTCKIVKPASEFHVDRRRSTGLNPCCKECLRRSSRRRTYNLDHDDLVQLLAKQNGRCAVCKDPVTEETLHVDHDHVTGKVRGLLCGACNTGLGLFRDSAARLRAAIVYLTPVASEPI